MPDLTSQDVAEIKSFLSRTCEDVLIWLPGTGWQPAWQSEAAYELGNSEVGANSSLLTRSPVPMRPPPADRGNRRTVSHRRRAGSLRSCQRARASADGRAYRASEATDV